MIMKLYLFLSLQLFSCYAIEIYPKATLDEFFNYTTFPLLKFSPTGQHLLFQTRRPSWHTNTYENTLWLYDIQKQTKILITKNLHKSIKPQWSPSGKSIALLLDSNSCTNCSQLEQYIYLYSLALDKLLPVQIGLDISLAFTWSSNDSSLYLVEISSSLTEKNNDLDSDEWKDVIEYRKNQKHIYSKIYRVDLNEDNLLFPANINIIKNVSFLISELLFVPIEEKLICSSASWNIENVQDFELYSINLRNISSLSRLTNNVVLEKDLSLSYDGKYILFRTFSRGSSEGKINDTQERLYSLDLINGEIIRLGESFNGNIMGYTLGYNQTIYIFGQEGTEVQIYTEQLQTKNFNYHNGWNGSYESLASSNKNQSLAFVYSSFEKPMEIYIINNIEQLSSAQIITNENDLLTQRSLPRIKVYRWKNDDDDEIIEGLLHYPPGQYESKNLPLLVLIHGGPYAARLNRLEPDWYYSAPLMASEGWLVLEPNYRGSTGYGDKFLNKIRYKPLSGPGKDILSGIDHLIKDGIVDSHKLTVGGYSYGGFLTNWLITQTQQFNAALSGSGAIDFTSAWGIMDLPILIGYLFGGFPWEVPHIYQNEAPIYQFDKVHTPTHIVTGDNDIRVPASQSYMLERALYYRKVPVKLIAFPNEGHELDINPWYGKIKVREELKWLQKYGHQSSINIKN